MWVRVLVCKCSYLSTIIMSHMFVVLYNKSVSVCVYCAGDDTSIWLYNKLGSITLRAVFAFVISFFQCNRSLTLWCTWLMKAKDPGVCWVAIAKLKRAT